MESAKVRRSGACSDLGKEKRERGTQAAKESEEMPQQIAWQSHVRQGRPRLVLKTPATLPRCSLGNRVYSVDLVSNRDLRGGFMGSGLNTLGHTGLQALTVP